MVCSIVDSEKKGRLKETFMILLFSRRESTKMVCQTSKAKPEDLNKYLFVEAEFDQQSVPSRQSFMYINDPVVNQTLKKKAIVR